MTPDQAYDNGGYIPDASSYKDRWAQAASVWRESLSSEGRARLGLAYGRGARNRYDLFLPESAPRGLVVFIHGGYWRAFDNSFWSHLAAGPVARGWAVAMPSYTLAPEARISQMTREVALATEAAAADISGPIVLTGHSAGGHLSARMRCADVALPDAVAGRIARIVPISPLSDLRPLMETSMNADLRLDAPEAAAESPMLRKDLRDIPTAVWVGAEERPAFLDQARWLAEAWPQTDLRIAPGRHHFDVIAEMEDAGSPLTRALLDGL
ncbi:MAG: alpha/beta hydrolase [Rhodobacteraceae bacterium]|nr:alpha/beta hydrolase [Paracoccaceae bacterium]